MQTSVRVRVRLAAHDFWLAATPWQPESRVTITANIGEIFPVATDRMTPENAERWFPPFFDSDRQERGEHHGRAHRRIALVTLVVHALQKQS